MYFTAWLSFSSMTNCKFFFDRPPYFFFLHFKLIAPTNPKKNTKSFIRNAPPHPKTASEPNLLKIRLKQSVIERKARIGGPAGARRHERLLQAAQRRQQKNSVLTSTYIMCLSVLKDDHPRRFYNKQDPRQRG